MTRKDLVRTRIAPSPTGHDLHIGNLYTALINWTYARQNEGKFIIRVEDTDRLRFIEGAEEKIINSLKSFNLNFDEGPSIGGEYAPYRQSERLEIYKKYALELIQKGSAYYCICTKERLLSLREQQQKEKKQTRYDKYCLNKQNEVTKMVKNGASTVIRLNILPGKKMWFKDLIRGEISVNSDEVDDQVLMKSDGFPTYHLAVVVDDHLMNITHVIRAEEWISSTPKHVLLYESLGWKLPVFAHTPILRNPDKSKLSKRKNPVWVSWYIEEGFLPEAVLNYLSLMGWSHPDQKDIFSIDEFIKVFNLKDIKTVGPAFDIQKLTWMNQQYIQSLPDNELKTRIQNFYKKEKHLDSGIIEKVLPLVKTRMELLKDFGKLTSFFFTPPDVSIVNDKERNIVGDLIHNFSDTKDWNKDEILSSLKIILVKFQIKMPVLYKIFTGEETGLPLPESLAIMGKDVTISRLKKLIK